MRRVTIVSFSILLAGCEEAAVHTNLQYSPTPDELGKFWLCVISGGVLLFILVASLCYDQAGRRREWFENSGSTRRFIAEKIARNTKLILRKFRGQRAVEHRHTPNATRTPSREPNRRWFRHGWVRGLGLIAVGAVLLVGVSILVEHQTGGERWFLISWRSFGIRW